MTAGGGSVQPDFNRFLKVLRREGEPDRVPFSELYHDPEIMTAIQGPPDGPPEDVDAWARWWVKFWRSHGYDYVTGRLAIAFPRTGPTAPDTAILSRGERGWVDESKGPLASWEDFERYPWPEVTDEAFRPLEALSRYLPEGMQIVPMIPGGPLENLTFLMGYETFVYALADDPSLVAAIAEKVGDTLVDIVKRSVSFETVGAQWLNDDMGFRSGPLASPEVLRKHVFPYQRRMCEIAHAAGKPILLHSCGNLRVIMDELIDDVGIDAKHSFEHVIEPVWEAKRAWGARVALLGGVDMHVLAGGTEDEVRAYTRRCIEECAPGGGWALGSGNSVANYVPVRNFLAMLDEGRRLGVYSH